MHVSIVIRKYVIEDGSKMFAVGTIYLNITLVKMFT